MGRGLSQPIEVTGHRQIPALLGRLLECQMLLRVYLCACLRMMSTEETVREEDAPTVSDKGCICPPWVLQAA